MNWWVELSCTSCVRRAFILSWQHWENKLLLIYNNIKSQDNFVEKVLFRYSFIPKKKLSSNNEHWLSRTYKRNIVAKRLEMTLLYQNLYVSVCVTCWWPIIVCTPYCWIVAKKNANARFEINQLGQAERTKRLAKDIRPPLHTRRKRRCAYEQKRICQPILTNRQHDVRPTGDPVRKKMLSQTPCNS